MTPKRFNPDMVVGISLNHAVRWHDFYKVICLKTETGSYQELRQRYPTLKGGLCAN
jgi:hypothetical protein